MYKSWNIFNSLWENFKIPIVFWKFDRKRFLHIGYWLGISFPEFADKKVHTKSKVWLLFFAQTRVKSNWLSGSGTSFLIQGAEANQGVGPLIQSFFHVISAEFVPLGITKIELTCLVNLIILRPRDRWILPLFLVLPNYFFSRNWYFQRNKYPIGTTWHFFRNVLLHQTCYFFQWLQLCVFGQNGQSSAKQKIRTGL